MPKEARVSRVRTIYEFIRAHRHEFSVNMTCRVLDVAPSGYYDWLKQPVSNRAKEDARLIRLIRACFRTRVRPERPAANIALGA